uniref:Uncharacterized protein n=1 Tax=Periophthalmus magnuspinnatus TaxID=409849 RepID=A0A3B4BI90_9GOBI
MDPTSQFFAQLRKLAITFEIETTKLQSAFENRKSDDDDRKHWFIFPYIHSQGQIQDNVALQKTNVDEVSRFIKDCEVKQQKLSEDLNVIKAYWEKYGYRPPQQTTNQEEATEEEYQSSEEVGEHQQETERESSPEKPAAPLPDPMRTPQLSDFGLSEVQLKRALAGGEWCAEVPQMPEMILPHPALNTPAPPAMAFTPKRALRMDEEELLTPQMHDFGISEHTMCFNNDFTMDLRLKIHNTLQRHFADTNNTFVNNMFFHRPQQNFIEPPPPVFCTPGLKIKKTHPTTETSSDLESPSCPAILPSTPEVPAFQTPYVNRLLSTKKVTSKRSWEYNVPHLGTEDMMASEMPEMPNLESNLGNSLSANMQKKVYSHEKPIVSVLDLDGPTQDFNLGTPCVRRNYEEPSTPEMPDLSSVTQDICKVRPYAYWIYTFLREHTAS